MIWLIHDYKSKWAEGDTSDKKPMFKLKDIIKFMLEAKSPEDFYITFENGKTFHLIDYKMGDENNE